MRRYLVDGKLLRMKLQSYLDRINFEGTPRPDLATLVQLHRKHLLNISYENIDVQLGVPVGLDTKDIYRKIVEGGRGGWCYEMNGLINWALEQIGFEVTRVNGGVMRSERGEDALGNHLVLLVELDRTWVVDVGFGDGIIDPVPLETSHIHQRGFAYRLEALEDGYWRFHNHQYGGATSFDFAATAASESLFQEKCEFLQTSEQSPFVMNLVCQRFTPDGYDIQLGRVAKRVTPAGIESRIIDDAAILVSRLRTDFDLDVPEEVASIWPKVAATHERLFGNGDKKGE